MEIQLFVQDSVSAQQLAILDSMGTLCPYQFGDAVFRAQVLYNRYEEKVFLPVCAEERGSARNTLAENAVQDVLNLYPNPTTGWVTIPNPEAVPRTMLVLDITGKLVFQATTSASEIDLSGIANGVYLLRVRVTGTGEVATAKLVINK